MPTGETTQAEPAGKDKGVTETSTQSATADEAPFKVTIKHPDGELEFKQLSAKEHMRIYSQMVHEGALGLAEVVGAHRKKDKKLVFPKTREVPQNFVVAGDEEELIEASLRWLEEDKEVFVTPAAFSAPLPRNEGVGEARCVWVDIDEPENIDTLRKFEHPPHLVIESGGSGGVHAYWRLDQPINPDALKSANYKLCERLGGDAKSRNPARLLRVPGTFNYKPTVEGRPPGKVRVRMVDWHLPEYAIEDLIEGLEDPDVPEMPAKALELRQGTNTRSNNGPSKSNWIDETKAIFDMMPATEYFRYITGEAINANGQMISCPNPAHPDRDPSCFVYSEPGKGHWCFSCEQAGNDAVSLVAVLSNGSPRVDGDQFIEVMKFLADLVGIDHGNRREHRADDSKSKARSNERSEQT